MLVFLFVALLRRDGIAAASWTEDKHRRVLLPGHAGNRGHDDRGDVHGPDHAVRRHRADLALLLFAGSVPEEGQARARRPRPSTSSSAACRRRWRCSAYPCCTESPAPVNFHGHQRRPWLDCMDMDPVAHTGHRPDRGGLRLQGRHRSVPYVGPRCVRGRAYHDHRACWPSGSKKMGFIALFKVLPHRTGRHQGRLEHNDRAYWPSRP